MSIDAAAKELTKEIELLLKEADRLTRLRDEMVSKSVSIASQGAHVVTRKTAQKKTATKKTIANKTDAKKAAPARKRVLSEEGRKAISVAAKKRWAARKKANAAK